MGYLKSAGTVFIYIGLFLAIIAFLPGIPPDAQYSEFSISPLQSGLTNNPKHSKRLDDAEILFKGELKGPESFASYNGELYTTLHGGDVVKIVGKHIVPIAKFGKPCDGIWMEKECGRPLGLSFDKKGKLYVVDTYYGIFKVDVTSGKYEKIVDFSKPIEGAVPKLANSLDIASNGDIYWTDSSTEFPLQDGVYTLLANPSGRLIKYDAATKKNTVLLGNLGFANGIKLSTDESFVIVAETMGSRIMKFNLKGDKAGRAETFVDGIPGLPDNIHSDGADGFLVTLVMIADAEHPTITHSLSPHPNIRRMLARLSYLLEAPFKLIEDVHPNYYSKRVVHWIGHFESVWFLSPREGGGVLRIDAAGKIIDAAFSYDGKISATSSAYIFKDHIYLGSPSNEYLARVPLGRAFPLIKSKPENIVPEKVIKKREVEEPTKPVAQAKPTTTPTPPTTTTTTTTTTTQKPKPVTTTPKPAPASTQQPTTAAPPTTPRPATVAPPTTAKPPPPQQQKSAETTKPSKVATPEPARQVPASPPPPPPTLKKVPVGEAASTQQQPPSKPGSNEQTSENAKKTDDTAGKSERNAGNTKKSPPPNNAQPPTAVPVTGRDVKEAETKKKEATAKPAGTTPSPPRK